VELPNVFSDHVNFLGLAVPSLSPVFVGAEAERRDIVDQSVNPDVDDLSGTTRNWNAPTAGAFGWARDTEILQAAPNEIQYLILPCDRNYPNFIPADEILQCCLIGGEAEEHVLLFNRLWS
jgi:hypothetical protein